MVRRVGLVAVLTMAVTLIAADSAWARHGGGCGGGCGHGRRHRGHATSCGGGCGGCDSSCATVATCGGCGYATVACGGAVYGGAMPYAGAGWGGGAMYGAPAGSTMPPAHKGKGKKKATTGAEEEEAPTAAPASLVVTLAEGATLVVDGQVIAAAPGAQVFYTPNLQPGQDYFYTVQTQVLQDGQLVDVTRQVTVRAGEQSQVSFDAPADLAVVTE